MIRAASASVKGLTSDEFSGHTTRSGFGSSPARTRSARSRVASAWFSSTARRCALNSMPIRGTLPCTAAMRTVPTSSPLAGCATTPTANGTRISATPVTHCLTTSDATPAAANAARNPTRATPPRTAASSSGPPSCPQPTRNHGKPPKGQRASSASPVRTEAAAPTARTGHGRSAPRMNRASSTPGICIRPSVTANATYGMAPTNSAIHGKAIIAVTKPQTTARPTVARHEGRPSSATNSIATPAQPSHHSPNGWNDHATKAPPIAVSRKRARTSFPPDGSVMRAAPGPHRRNRRRPACRRNRRRDAHR